MRLGAAHDVDGVEVELAGHPRRLLVRPKLSIPTPGTRTIAGSAPRIGGLSGVGVPLVIGAVVVAVRRVQLLEPRAVVVERALGGRSRTQRPDLRPQEVIRAGRAERRQPRVLAAGQEVEDGVGSS